MKDLLLRARVVVRTSNMKISRRRLADNVKTLQQKACRTCSTIIFLHSPNQIIDLWCFRWRCRRQILNSLITPTKHSKVRAARAAWSFYVTQINHIIDLCFLVAVADVIRGSLRFDDGNVNDNATNQWFDWLNEKNNRAARFLVQCFDVVCQTTTWNFHIWGSDNSASSQQ